MHRPLGQQDQDGGADVATAPTPARTAAASTARSEPEAGTEPTGTKARTETPAESGPERPVVPGVVAAHEIAELPSGLPALLVQGAAVLRAEAETSGAADERRPERGNGAFMWCLVSGRATRDAMPMH